MNFTDEIINLESEFSKLLEEYNKHIHIQENIENSESSLHEFIKQAWPIVEGGIPFVDGWHIQAVAEHLEALAKRQILKLLINIPPRTSKTTVASIMFPAWWWIHAPHERYFFGSFAHKLSLQHSISCRRLILSSWYQNRWGDRFHLISDQNTKGQFDNDKRGYRLSTSVGSLGNTGLGGSMLFLDDPNSTEEVRSKIKRERAINWLHQSWLIRQNDPKNTPLLLMQQRSHEEDMSGHIIANDNANDWTKLIIPMELELPRRCFTIPLKSTEGKIWCDPRDKEGQLLWPERFGPKEVANLKKELGSEYNVAGQLQQRPSPAEGGVIKKNWFKWWKQEEYPRFEQVIQSWDTAFTDNKKGSYSACTTWGIFNDEHRVPNLMLIGMWRDHVLYPDLRKIAQKLALDYRYNAKNEDFVKNHSFKPDIILIEAKASGQSLIPDLRQAGILAIGFNPSKYGDKDGRVQIGSALIEGGRVWLPAMNPTYKQLRPFADTFLEECAIFPNGSSRDIVDSMTQVLIRVKEGGYIINPNDPENYEERRQPEFLY